MNETLKVMSNRRSIRKYQPTQISDAELQAIMEAAILAPSSLNQQKWHFSVVQNQELIDRMVAITKDNILNSGVEFLIKRASKPTYHTFYHAPTVIMVTVDANAGAQVDCGLAVENITLAAESLNIGSCIMTAPIFLFMSEKGKALRGELVIPNGYDYICTVTLGYKDESPAAQPRNKDVVSYIK
jgi:nitroreductase